MLPVNAWESTIRSRNVKLSMSNLVLFALICSVTWVGPALAPLQTANSLLSAVL